MKPIEPPEGFRLIPLEETTSPWVWRLAVVAQSRDDGGGQLVLLASSPDTRVYLGAVIDGRGLAREWIEIWSQNLVGLVSAGGDPGLTNAVLDQRWVKHWQWVGKARPETLLVQEVAPGQPIYVDLQAGHGIRPRLPQGGEWELCRDERELMNAGLPSYADSTVRILRATAPVSGSPVFAATDSDQATGKSASEPGPELGFEPNWLPLNPQGGHLAICTHALLNFDDYVDLLNGLTIDELKARKPTCAGAALGAILAPQGAGAWRLPLVAPRATGLELFFLKVRLLRQAVGEVESWLRHGRTPLLNLDPAAFGVDVAGGEGLPWPWTTKCSLHRPGRARAFTIPGSAAIEFIPFGQPGLPDYCPEGLGEAVDEEATIRLINLVVDAENRLVIEGQLTSRTLVRSSDHLRFRLRVPGLDELTFFARVVGGPGAAGTVSFVTWPRNYSGAHAERLRREVGRRIVLCWCACRPVISSPYDAYSLSVLGLRALVDHQDNPLTLVVGDLEELGRIAGRELKEGDTIGRAGIVIEGLLAKEGAWPRLQPVHLGRGLKPDALPHPPLHPRLWAEALAILLRLTPGLGPVSQCSDYGAAPPDALHAPLADPLAALDSLVARARSLLFDDWAANREARAILARLRQS